MAKGIKTGGRDFKPGGVGNPLGGGAHNPELNKVRRMTKEEVSEVGALILSKDLSALQEIVNSASSKSPSFDPKKYSVLKIWFASIAVKAIQKGDPLALNAILNRIVGKVPEEIKHTGNLPGSSSPIIILPSNGRESKT